MLVLNKGQLRSGNLPTVNRKGLLSVEQEKIGEVDTTQIDQHVGLGKITTDTGMVLEECEMAIGDLWSEGKRDKGNQQVKSYIGVLYLENSRIIYFTYINCLKIK